MKVEAYLESPISINDISVEYITPEKAREWVACQGTNRKLKPRLLFKIMGDIKNGLWRVNGGTFCFDKHGRLVDGQHRCNAIIKTGIGVWGIIVRNVPADAVQTIDTGVSRTASDIFTFADVKDAALKAAVVRASRAIEAGIISGHSTKSVISSGSSAFFDISNVSLLNMYLENAEDYDYAALKGSSYVKRKNLINKAFLGGMIYHLIHNKHHPREKVEDFLENLFVKRDADMEVINKLRDILVDYRMRNKTSKIKMDSKYLNALFIKTWNAYITHKDLKVLKYSESVEGKLTFL